MNGSFAVLPRCAYRPSRVDFSYSLRSKMQWAMTARSAKKVGDEPASNARYIRMWARVPGRPPSRSEAISPESRATMARPNLGCRRSRGGAHGRNTCPGRAARRLSRHHAEPAAATQRVQRGDAAGAQTRARRGRGGLRLPRAIADRRRPRLLRGAGFARADHRRRQDDRAREHVRHLLQPARAQAAHIAVPGGCRRQRRRGRRGANIALACDIVLAARSASFVQAFAKIGLIPDCGGTWFLPRLVGPARARGLALTAEPLPADKAEAWGLIWKTFDDSDLMAQAHQLCVQFTAAPTVALALIKRALDETWGNDLDAQLDLERESQREASLTPDYAEGVRAFLQKRPPAFTGRRAP